MMAKDVGSLWMNVAMMLIATYNPIKHLSNKKEPSVPSGTTVGPKSPRYLMIFLIDSRIEVSMRPRRPSAVPEDCIILCMERKTCFKIAVRATGRSPGGSK
jgi:hypothetical protein